ncbi:MAG: carbohydrate kinase family protein [Anaerolineae bacterium]|jgi:ribokinase|nr:carbohydrate kinase family protein [Anaerolineae bacterium]
MTHLQIVGLGQATLDVLLRLRDLPTWETYTRLQGFGLEGGGPAATALVAAAKLGARVGFVGTAGNDAAAESKLRSMRACGVDLSRLVVRAAPEGQVTGVFVHSETGERTFALMTGPEEHLLRVDELDRDYIESADYLHLDGFHAQAALQAARWMRAAGKQVVLDGHRTTGPIKPHMAALVEHVDILISGAGFVQALTGISDTLAAGAAALRFGPRLVVQTEGAGGSYTVTAHDRFHTPAFEVAVLDTTGAGDVFHGAYIVGLLHGWDLRDIAQFATAVAAIKCGKLGGRAGIPSLKETQVFLKARGVELGVSGATT